MNKFKYIQHFSLIFSGNAVAYIIYFFSYPTLARLYTPDDFGALSIFFVTASIIGTLSCGRFDVVIQVSKFFERFAIFRIAIYSNAIISLLSTFCLIFINFFSTTVATAFILLLGVSIFLIGYTNAAISFLLKHEEYKLTSVSIVVRTFFTVFIQISVFLLLPSFLGLALGLCFGYFAQSLALYCTIRKVIPLRKVSLHQQKMLFYKYKKYLFMDVPSSFINIIMINIMSYFIFFLYSNKELGFYSIACKLVAVPLITFSGSLSQVFFQKAAKAYHATGTFWEELKITLLMSIFFAIIFFILTLFIIKPFIKLYLGDVWLPTADFIIYLLPLFTIRFVSSSISTMPLIIGKLRVLLFVNISLLLCMGLIFLITYFYSISLNSYLQINSIVLSVIYFCFVIYVVCVVRNIHTKKVVFNL